MIGRLYTRPITTMSSSVAIGTATLFVTAAAMLSLALDRPGAFAASWSLRGTIAPAMEANPPSIPAPNSPAHRAGRGDPLDYA